MRKIGVFPNPEKDKDLQYTSMLVELIRSKGGEVLLEKDIAEKIGKTELGISEEQLLAEAEIIAVLGGDGSFLNAARKAYNFETPILGINLGRLGFLTELNAEEIGQAAEKMINGEYRIEKRMVLSAVINSDKSDTKIAVNDIVIARGAFSRIIETAVYVDDIYVDSYPGDGLVIASPTGSTAYSLSAGGPIVDPESRLMVITPICPHTLHARSFITTGNKKIRVELKNSRDNEEMLTIDGQQGYKIKSGDKIEIKIAEKCVNMVKIHDRNFYDILREKFN